MSLCLRACLAGLLVWVPLWAQVPFHHSQLGDKTNGEEEAINRRVQWFAERRGLDSTPNPNEYWRKAITDTQSLAAETGSRSPGAIWVPRGPASMTMLSWDMGRVAGRVSAFAHDLDDDQLLYLGTASGGLWRSTDGGNNWTSIFDQVGTQTIGAIWIQPGSPKTIWVGTGEQGSSCTGYMGMGLYKSTDGGNTWQASNGAGAGRLAATSVVAITGHPTDSQVLLVSGERDCVDQWDAPGGIFRSADGGGSWTKVLSGYVNDVLADPENPGTFYASIGRWSSLAGNGIYKSTDGGLNWDRLENGIPFENDVSRSRIAMAPSDSSILYMLSYGSAGGLFRTEDGGQSWTRQNANACEGQCSYNLCLDVHPDDPDTVLVGSIRFALSTNAGVNLNYLTSGWGGGQKVHQDTHVVSFHRGTTGSPANGNRFWVGSDGGLWRTDDGGTNFVNLNANLNITQFYDIAVHPDNPEIVLGGAQDNSSSRTTGTPLWNVTIVTGDGFMNLFDPNNPDIAFQTSYPSWNGSGYVPSLVRSYNGGEPGTFNWLSMDGIPTGEPWGWVTPLANAAIGGTTDTAIFVGSNRVYRSVNEGDNWTPISTALSSDQISVVHAQSTGSDVAVLVGYSDGKVGITYNGTAASPDWQDVTGTLPSSWVADLAMDPDDTNRIYMVRSAFGGAKLFRSDNSGGTWLELGAGLPDVPANAVAVDPLQTSRIFVGNDVGVFVSEDFGANFVPFMDGLPLGTVVTDLEIDDDPYWLTLGSYGRGVWQIALTPSDLGVEGGPNAETCSGRGVLVSVTATGGSGSYSYDWQVAGGPDTDLDQFDDTSLANPTFTPSVSGQYTLRCTVSDGSGSASADVSVSAGNSLELLWVASTHWLETTGSPGWDPQLDLDANGRIDLLDLVLRVNNPACDE
ncbi:PKD domain-containing protein [Sulfidibacter corallicola]|uniref:PKD domain-containing protein n=1 Tax=Sulfidibacter corallicola TaxID=2818388 RepID=A0A8A4TI32_SULCO|nr:hypothetical protein [Sulfidibacter corallicola]QTD48438.1 hypothetical protein J3U87_22895 [Sulfidibacter corallicola]